MKLQVPLSSAFPAVVATASALLLLVMLPAGGATVRSSGVAPALKLVAGDVVAAVEAPVRVASRPQPKPKPVGTHAAAPTTTAQIAHSAPVHRHAEQRVQASRPRVVASRPVTKQAAPAPSSPAAEHGHGRAKALGHVRKAASQSTPVNATLHVAGKNTGHVKAHGRPAEAPQGPPAAPPGQAKKVDAVVHGASADRGGGK
jgi:hypothetical protein